MKIGVITHEYSSRGAACLEALLAEKRHQLLVILPKSRYHSRSAIGSTWCFLQRQGLKRFLEVGWKVLRARWKVLAASWSSNGRSSCQSSSVLELLERNSLNFLMPENRNDKVVLEKVRSFGPEILVTVSTDMILDESWLQLPTRAAINVHPSLLPKYRGPDPLYWQIKNGESIGGITIHYLSKEIDGGDILNQESFPIFPTMTENQLNQIVDSVAPLLLLKTIQALEAGVAKGVRQDPAFATYFGERRT